MARKNIDIGVQGNDGTGDSIRESFRKVNDNFTQLFAVFGQGDRIAFTDLDDTPNTYGSDQVMVSNNAGDAIVAKKIVGGENISVDYFDENEIVITATGGRLSSDIRPTLGGHLNGENFSIGNIANPSNETADLFNALHGLAGEGLITADDLVMTRGYADQRYLQSTGGPGAGSQIRVRSEPLNADGYQKIVVNWINGYAVIPEHGFNTGSNGAEFRYVNDGTTPATGLISGTVYYIRYLDEARLSIHETRDDALLGDIRILVNVDPEISAELRGEEHLVDAFYDETLQGNWLTNEALPRESVVRRQGDEMTGVLTLSDHPGSLAGQGTPNGPDDLQAATKFYVDNSSFASATNLFVAPSGDDTQANTPAGKEGRAFAYAYASVNAACAKAEELINESLIEPGPYRQEITYGNYSNIAKLDSVDTNLGNRRTLKVFTNGVGVDQSKNIDNRDLREGSIIKGLRSGATARTISYNGTLGLNDEYSVELLHKTTDRTNFESNYNAAAERLVVNKDFIVAETVAYINNKYESLIFDANKCARDVGLIVDALAFDLRFGGNIKTVRAGRAYWNGVTSVLPVDQTVQTVDGIHYIYELADFILDNTILPAPVEVEGESATIGKRTTISQNTSGTVGEVGSKDLTLRLVEIIENIVANGVNGDGTLLEFLIGEPLEFGQPVPELQISIRVESGVYYEQLPIRVPANVSIKGDEFRRCIIRPAPGASQSPWADLYFFRDSTFDGMTRTYVSPADATTSFVAEDAEFPGSAAYWKVTTSNTAALETGMYLYVTAGTGVLPAGTQVVRKISPTEFEISNAPSSPLTGATIRGLNSSGLAPVGHNFGYHYLTDPTGMSGIFDATVAKTGGHTGAAALLTSGKTTLQTQVINYVNTTYGEDFEYDSQLCFRDVGLIIDALIFDITQGGSIRASAAGYAYSRNVSGRIAITAQLEQTLAAMTYLNTKIQELLIATPVPATIVNDLISGIKNIIQGNKNSPKENKDMDVFLLNDACILRNITCQGHGGFMCVLDPEGQIQTKSPYFQTNTSLTGSTNKQRFAGGMLIDGFSGNLPARVISKNSNFELQFDGLTIRAPGVPNSFYINGARYQINAVSNYNRVAGTATISLDSSTPYTLAVTTPVDIIIETPGNRSMLANDFTQVNDLSYGVVATNNGISELVSVFTYYNWASYYAVNGGQIRSLNGSSCNGVYGLKAAGRDPNEVADPVILQDNTLQVAKIFKRAAFSARNLAGDIALYLDNYLFQPYNISEIEIDHSNTRSSAVVNTPTQPNNAVIVNAGTGYAVGEILTVQGGTLYPSSNATQLIVTAISGGGATGPISEFDIIEPGTYSINPVGGYPTVSGIVTVVSAGAGINATFDLTYLGSIETYEVSNTESTTSVGVGINSGGVVGTRQVLRLNLNSDSASGLKAPLVDGQDVIIRGLQNFRFSGIEEVKPVRPSTALEFTDPQERSVYRTLSYGLTFPGGGPLPAEQAVLSFDNSFDYVIIQTNVDAIEDVDYVDGAGKTMGSSVGDTRIAVLSLNDPREKARLNSGDMIMGWAGKVHVVDEYVDEDGAESAYVTLSALPYGEGSNINVAGIAQEFTVARTTNLRVGLQKDEPAEITVNISTCRATGHDFLDIGSGGFNSTNYPNNLLGAPTTPPSQSQEAIEETQGRVFYVSTDQDGIFRVGKFFTVDQGTGTVTFKATIALSNLDGIGFKRGTVVKEFSTDATFSDNADDAVPTEAAVQGYIDRRLGYDRNSNPITLGERIPIGGGFLPIIGAPTLEADLSMGSIVGHRITNLVPNINSESDAANIGYVDAKFALSDSLNDLKEVIKTGAAKGDVAIFAGNGRILTNTTVGGDITGTLTSPATTTLEVAITSTDQAAVNGGITVDDVTDFPAVGYIQIGSEIFSYTGRNVSTNMFEGVTRAVISSSSNTAPGYNIDASTASTHLVDAEVISLTSSELNLEIKDQVIFNANVNDAAAIAQSKLSMNTATTRANATGITQADRGLASFDSANFEVTNGWVGIKAGGISLSEIQTIGNGSILGNTSGSTAAPSELSLGTVVTTGINSLFTAYDNGASVLTRREKSLRSNATFTNRQGAAITGSGTIQNIPVTTVSGTGNGAIVSVSYANGSYTDIQVTYGGNNYTAGDSLIIKGSLLGTGGLDGVAPVGNDLSFDVIAGDIDTAVYLGLHRVSISAEANSIIRTDVNKNLGTRRNRFNTIFADLFDGTVTNATNSVNLVGGATGGIAYQVSANTTGFLPTAPAGRYLTSTGIGVVPTWSELAIPDGSAETLSGDTLAGNVVNSSLTSVGTLTSLTVSGLITHGAQNGIVAAGSTQLDATQLNANINIVETVPLNSGVRLPSAVPGYRIIIKNASAATLRLWPSSGDSINAGINDEDYPIPAGGSLEFYAANNSKWYTLNATFAAS
jgi:hypothetical protein